MKRTSLAATRHGGQQRGVTLVVALVMLGALALMAAWAVRSSVNNVRIVGNGQARQEAFNVAQAAIERTISAPTFSQQPDAVAANPVTVDLDGDGVADLSATLSPAPTCYRLRVVRTSELDANVAADLNCMKSSAAQTSGLEVSGSTANTDSLCADSEWNLRAVVTDPRSGAQVVVNQGVAARGLITDALNACP